MVRNGDQRVRQKLASSLRWISSFTKSVIAGTARLSRALIGSRCA
jgi:hypothetical protein